MRRRTPDLLVILTLVLTVGVLATGYHVNHHLLTQAVTAALHSDVRPA